MGASTATATMAVRPRWSDFDELPIPEHRLPHPPVSSAPVLRDIRLWTEQKGRVGEVLASSAVTQLIVRLRHADGKGWYSAPKRLVFSGELAALPSPVDDDDRARAEEAEAAEDDDEGPAAWARAPSAKMHLLLKLGDLELVTVKAYEVDTWGGSSELVEREFVLPLNKRERIGDVLHRIKSADALEPREEQILRVEEHDRMSMVMDGRVLKEDAELGKLGVSSDTVLHLVVHRSAKINVRHLRKGLMEVTITTGLSKEALYAAATASANAAATATEDERRDEVAESEDELSPVSPLANTRGPVQRLATGCGRALAHRSLSLCNVLLLEGEEPEEPAAALPNDVSAAAAAARPPTGLSKMSLSERSAPRMTPSTPPSWGSHASGGVSPTSSSSLKAELCQSVERARHGLRTGRAPALAPCGTGGTYFLCDANGEKVAVFKPEDEEPLAANNPRGQLRSATGEGLRKGTRVGEGALREVAAFLLDKGHFAGVPPTTFGHLCGDHVRLPSEAEAAPKRGSLQQYVEAVGDCEERGTRAFAVHEVHKIACLDLRLANTDRNGANILVRQRSESERKAGEAELELIPIDHGYTLPHTLQDVSFEWEYWHQAEAPFEPATLQYIASLDSHADVRTLAAAGIELPPECAKVLHCCTALLQRGAAAGLSPAAIAAILTRRNETSMSDLEKMVNVASRAAAAAGKNGNGSGAAERGADDEDGGDHVFLHELRGLLDEYLADLREDCLLDQVA